MSGLAERIPHLHLPRLPRRSRPARPLVVDGHPSPVARVFGLGSIYGKALRDSRRGFLLAGLGVGLIVFFTASQVAAEFGTVAARAAMAALPLQLPLLFRGLLGEPIDIARLGAFLSWRTLNFMTLVLGAWAIVSLSGSLVGEARRGTLEFVLATPRGRANVAVQKAGAFATAMAIAVLVIGLITWVATIAYATQPGDTVSLADALAHMVWLGLIAIFPGAIAWALAPVVGRGAAAGVAAVVMAGSYIVHGYRDAIPSFEALDRLSYFGWTAHHRPLAGVTDWPSVGLLALVELVLIGLGVLAFRARDVGITLDVGVALPRLRLGLHGAFGRSFAERLPVAAWWAIGIGGLGAVFGLSVDSFVEAMRSVPQVEDLVQRFFPGVDIFSTGGVLQLVFFEMGTLFVIALAAMLAGGWSSDETERRLELVLSAPLSRLGWALRSGFGAQAAVLAFAVVVAGLIALGALANGDDAVAPAAGSFVLAAYGAALLGVGLAVGGLVRPSLAAGIAAGLGLAFYLLAVLGAALRLPPEIVDLSLVNHLGKPMAGVFDPVGTAACLVLAVGGTIVGALGMARRDIGR